MAEHENASEHQLSLPFAKPAGASLFGTDVDDDATTPTAAPSQSLDTLDAIPPSSPEHYQLSLDTNESSEDTSLSPQSRKVFHTTIEAMNKNAEHNHISVAPTFPSHGVLGRFDSDYGDDDVSQDEEFDVSIHSSSDDECHSEGGAMEDGLSSSLAHASAAPERGRSRYASGSSSSSSSTAASMPQSFRPFEERRSSDSTSLFPSAASFRCTDSTANTTTGTTTIVTTTESVDANSYNNNNITSPQCRHTPSVIISSEASYIFQQLDEMEMRMTSPSGITYNKPKYLQPTASISGDKFANSLPVDAIHAISSYCDGKSWMALCHTSSQWHRVGWEVISKIRMHAFRCAGEVLLAWARGEHADARELAALYIKNGVLIYPSPLGHAYHTLAWKMGVEITAMQTDDAERGKSEEEGIGREVEKKVDPYYTSRYQNQDNESAIFTSSMMTYVEDKCSYWKKEKGIESHDAILSATLTPTILPPLAPPMDGGVVNDLAATSADTANGDRHSATAKVPKMTIRIHRHLADQHFFGVPSIDDEDGNMNEVECNMNADFYHPTWEPKRRCVVASSSHHGHLLGGGRHLHWQRQPRRSTQDILDLGISSFEAALEDVRTALASRNGSRRGSSFLRSDSLPSLTNSSLHDGNGRSSNSPSSAASDVQLEIYSTMFSSVKNAKSDTDEERRINEIISMVRSRCARYQLKLETFLANFDTFGFDECLLDFWDEVFPLTNKIHYYNGQTAVPRMSQLRSFLTKPCPKAVGVMQCEIERVKISSGRGRFFPTYEYRLFVRDTKNDNTQNIASFPPRKDSVLLVAKNKNGGKYIGTTDTSSSSTTSSKRGVTNYYLSLPQQRDVDMHYRSVNEHAKHSPTGLSVSPAASQSKVPIQVGRLQSNFIGTEFQIFNSPKIVKIEEGREEERQSQRNNSPSSRENDCQPEQGDQVHPAPEVNDLDTAVPTTTVAPQRSSSRRRGSSLVRFARRASNGLSRKGSRGADEDDREETTLSRKKMLTSKVSWGSSPRPSRRAIANDPYIEGVLPTEQFTMVEEENGAITYTANLLGNRPRIMDVCIPMLEGISSDQWRNASDEAITADDSSRMLNLFKSIQQQRGSPDDENALDTIQDSARDHGLMVFQNRPPWWNVELGAFVLNFGGRVSVASVKNFQLCERRDQEHVLQFGRIQGRHNFTVDFQYPLTPAQAFAIAISSLQSKISFG